MSNLDGLNFIADYDVEDTVLYNTIYFIRQGLLEVGAFYNIPTGQLDAYGNDESQLRPVSYPTGHGGNKVVEDYTMYRGKRNDWIWESDVSLKYSGGQQPIVPSGIFVNGVFYPTGTTIDGTGYYLDFSRGGVVFDNPMPNNSVVQVPHAVRYVSVYAKNSEEYRKIEGAWYGNSGTVDNLEPTVYLPSMTIDVRRFRTVQGVEIGTRAKIARATIEFSILANSDFERRKLSSIVYMLESKTFNLFDLNKANSSGVLFPLNYRGEFVQPNANWNYLSTNFGFGPTPNASSLATFEENADLIKIEDTILPYYRARATIDLRLHVYPH